MHPLSILMEQRQNGIKTGIYSCCSADEFVLRSAIEVAAENNCYVLIEATANQVDQYGGYTVMKPSDFAAFVLSIAE